MGVHIGSKEELKDNRSLVLFVERMALNGTWYPFGVFSTQKKVDKQMLAFCREFKEFNPAMFRQRPVYIDHVISNIGCYEYP